MNTKVELVKVGDIKCRVCGEPYEFYGFIDDFSKKELDNLLNGKGCPSCGGTKPEGAKDYGERTLDWIRSIDEGTDLDPCEFL